jgi:hypothetical protein
LLDLQVGSASKFRITKAGYIQFIAGSSSPSMGPVGTSLVSLGVFNAALSDYADLWTSSNYVKGVLSVNDHLSIGTTHGTSSLSRLVIRRRLALLCQPRQSKRDNPTL